MALSRVLRRDVYTVIFSTRIAPTLVQFEEKGEKPFISNIFRPLLEVL
jgi:hypothetical protein